MTTRRDLFKLGALAAAAAALPSFAIAAGEAKPVGKAARPLNILILGGTGFTGPFQVEYALKRGHKVTLFNRGKRPSPEWPAAVEQLHGDRNTGDLAALKGRTWDVCIDNPTSLPFWVRDAGQVLKGNVGHYLFISTISVYADGSKPGINENSPLAQYKGKDAMAETQQTLRADIENLYGPLKALSEAEAHKQFGKNVTIVRPGYIVGPRDETDRFTYWPHRVAQGGEILVPGDGNDPIQIIDGRDLGEWMIRLAEAGTTGTFNACGPDYPLSMDAMLYGCQAVTGGGMTLTHVSPAFLDEQQVGLPIWVPSKDNPYAGYGAVSNERAIAAGLTFRPLATTVQDLLAWFHSLPAERQAKLGAGITREKEAELLKAWHARKG
ncbi:NAD-dependent epimerase/dehydratase family protein [Pseudoxanthomonas mexicana]|uniref:NAD-dependent epimerase/dehydratase family protein n=1 Tax=Pseudoxanthomonas mexicana TaxID=128785 RepID=A0ABX6REJ0_PSEMX|nr:NAD-dependent epimerase/dehydratase family protein [Pseudoxanthomonas mexicana]QLQ28809.1 MAG: NAD-dependent epimerase/dehydratase family protein [Pseudoxanthomonas sp.]QND81431.1 NAD-dependent epimerase/dehydratase family protein [Pseudoxanthomonas mexicana]